MTDQDKTWIKDWIDDLIELKRRVNGIADYDENLRSCEGLLAHQIHIHTGIEKVAEALGLEMQIANHCTDKKQIVLDYKGVTIKQIVEEEDAKNILHSQS